MTHSLPEAVHSTFGVDEVARRAVAGVLRAYQLTVSPMLGRNCRFEPSCSHFAADAVRRHGVVRGGRMAARRVLRCHPWGGPGGFDPVP